MIEASHVTKRCGSILAVDDLSFTVPAGQVTGLLGPNGSGKSTTMRMIVGLDTPSGGRVTVAGRSYGQLRFPLHEVGALLDAGAVHPGRTARNHLIWLADSNHIARGRVDEVLDVVGLTGAAQRRAGELSLAQLSIGVLGVLVMTSEYSTGTIKLTLGATPQRSVLLAAKVATFSAVVAVVSLISCFAAFWICQALLGPKHAGVSIGDPGVLRAVIGGALHLVLIGAIAVGLGVALRRTAGAGAILFAVLLVLPGLVLLLLSPWKDDITRYLPNSAGAAMSAVVHFPNLLAPRPGSSSSALTPQPR